MEYGWKERVWLSLIKVLWLNAMKHFEYVSGSSKSPKVALRINRLCLLKFNKDMCYVQSRFGLSFERFACTIPGMVFRRFCRLAPIQLYQHKTKENSTDSAFVQC